MNTEDRTALRARITKRIVDSLQAGDAVWDTELPGFFARRQDKKVSYGVKYRHKGGRASRQVWYTIGKHGAHTPDTARKEASKVLLEVSSGSNPAAARKQGRAAVSVGALWAKYLQDHAQISKKPRSVAEDQALARDYILPQFGRVAVEDLTRADVSRWHASLGEKPIRANRALALLRSMMAKAELWGYRSEGTNPASKIPNNKERPRARWLSRNEFKRLEKALSAFDQAGGCPPSATALIRLLALTGMRLGEARGLRWNEVDFRHKTLRLHDSKTGAKTVPLTPESMAILKSLGPPGNNTFVFVGKSGNSHINGIQKIWQRVRRHAGLVDVRLHDLRHSYASVAAQSGVSLQVIGKMLGHRNVSTTQRYAHLSMNPVLEASQRTARDIAKAMTPKAKRKSRNP